MLMLMLKNKKKSENKLKNQMMMRKTTSANKLMVTFCYIRYGIYIHSLLSNCLYLIKYKLLI